MQNRSSMIKSSDMDTEKEDKEMLRRRDVITIPEVLCVSASAVNNI